MDKVYPCAIKYLFSFGCVCEFLGRVRLCNLMECSPPGSSIQGILQARVLEWVSISFSPLACFICHEKTLEGFKQANDLIRFMTLKGQSEDNFRFGTFYKMIPRKVSV